MNRLALGLAVGAGYVLGRTKKMKLAFAIGTMVAGKRMHLSPRALADLVSQQLQNNPQFKEIGDQLREDLRGVGQAASGALVERQLDAFADRLHGRTAQVRDQLEGVVPETPDLGLEDEEDEEPESEELESEERESEEPEAEDEEPEEAPRRKAAKKAPAKKGAARTAESAVKKAPAKKTATKKAPAKKTAAKKTAAKKTAAKKTTAASGAARSARARVPKGGGER
ncbi:DNA primase [Streptomyces sp. NBC_00299]|uniref:DNA primase n=1 Tax=Streptomyces sp. NBC_00299 TaxID=2975705 RepID=UPI002E2C689C|nr:DNA primase [Streptomyces sp. NBC_00299]